MMGALRDKKFMKFVLWFIVVVFVGFIFLAWGMQISGIDSPASANAVAHVGKKAITYPEFYKRFQPAQEQLYGSDSEAPSEQAVQELQKEILDSLIEDTIILETAQRLGIQVSMEEVAESIRRERVFLDENQRFDSARYLRLLQENNLTPEDFEASQRQNLLLQKIQVILSGSALASPGELRSYADLLNRRVRADRVALDSKRIASALRPEKKDLQDYYESHRDRYDRPERAKARHLLLSLREGATAQEAEVIEKTLEDYRQQVSSGKAKFADLAAKFSQDEGSKKDGGSLGWITRGLTLPEFEDALFALKKGAVSKPVRTRYGYHLIQLENYEPAYESTFEAVRTKVEEDWRSRTADRRVAELSVELSKHREAGESLRKAASDLDLDVTSTDWFSRGDGIPGMTDTRQISDSLLEAHLGEWKGPFYTAGKRLFFQITAEKDIPLSEESFEKQKAGLADRLTSVKRDRWVKDFVRVERERQGVRIHLDRDETAPDKP